MLRIKKLAAFTLSEMIVVLIISAIVMGLAFTTLNLVHKHLIIIQRNLGKTLESNRLEEVLTIDFDRYRDISYNLNGGFIVLKNPIDSVRYQFKNHITIRERDTFELGIDKLELYFKGDIIQGGNVDALKASFDNTLNGRSFFVFKLNDASTYMDLWHFD